MTIKNRTNITTETLAEYFSMIDGYRTHSNPMGAPRMLVECYGISFDEASKITQAWMDTYDADKSPEERAEGVK